MNKNYALKERVTDDFNNIADLLGITGNVVWDDEGIPAFETTDGILFAWNSDPNDTLMLGALLGIHSDKCHQDLFEEIYNDVSSDEVEPIHATLYATYMTAVVLAQIAMEDADDDEE